MMKQPCNLDKGKRYEEFSNNILLLEKLTWENGVIFDQVDNHYIVGASSAKHQIDIHLTSSNNPQYHLLCECKNHSNGTVKMLVCSFVTVINDIKQKHPDWSIIPVFASNYRFQRGATQIALYNGIVMFDLSDLRMLKSEIIMKVSSATVVFKSIVATMRDGSTLLPCDYITNIDNPGRYKPEDIIGYYICKDINKTIIESIVTHRGYFRAEQRKKVLSNADRFVREKDGVEIESIEGEIVGKTRTSLNEITVEQFFSNITARLIIDNTNCMYLFMKDGSIKRKDFIRSKLS